MCAPMVRQKKRARQFNEMKPPSNQHPFVDGFSGSVTSTCGSSFLSGSVAAAAGLSGGIIGGDDSSGAGMLVASTGLVGALAGAVALALGAL